jgi:hypothetical protein
MSIESASIRRRGWPGAILWSILVVVSVVLMAIGLWTSFFVGGYRPLPAFENDARVGNLYILGGSAASLAAAVWSHLRGHPHWATAFVAAPAIVVGGIALLAPHSTLRQLGALATLPAALGGLAGGLIAGGYRRVK